MEEVRCDGDVATRLHQEGSYTMLNRRLTSRAEPVRKQEKQRHKPRVIRRLWGRGGGGEERAFYKGKGNDQG